MLYTYVSHCDTSDLKKKYKSSTDDNLALFWGSLSTILQCIYLNLSQMRETLVGSCCYHVSSIYMLA